MRYFICVCINIHIYVCLFFFFSFFPVFGQCLSVLYCSCLSLASIWFCRSEPPFPALSDRVFLGFSGWLSTHGPLDLPASASWVARTVGTCYCAWLFVVSWGWTQASHIALACSSSSICWHEILQVGSQLTFLSICSYV